MPIYLIQVDTTKPGSRLVEAKNEAAARKHVAGDVMRAEAIRSANQIRAMAGLAASGTQVERAAEVE